MRDFDILISEYIGSFDCPCATPLASNKFISVLDSDSGERCLVVVRSKECWSFICEYTFRYKRYPSVSLLQSTFTFERLVSHPSLF